MRAEAYTQPLITHNVEKKEEKHTPAPQLIVSAGLPVVLTPYLLRLGVAQTSKDQGEEEKKLEQHADSKQHRGNNSYDDEVDMRFIGEVRAIEDSTLEHSIK